MKQEIYDEEPETKFEKLFGLRDNDFKLVTSAFVNPKTLFYIRLSVAVWATVSSVVDTVWNLVVLDRAPEHYYAFFTRMSWVGLTAYFGAAALHSGSYIRSLRISTEKQTLPTYYLQRWGKFLQFCHQLLYVTVVTYPPMVTVVYWALLFSEKTFQDPYSAWSNLTFHLFNGLIIYLELFLCRIPINWIWVIFIPIIQGLYLGTAYITHATQGIYTYSFLDPTKVGGKLPFYMIGVALSGIIFFCIALGLTRLRDRFKPLAKGSKKGSRYNEYNISRGSGSNLMSP